MSSSFNNRSSSDKTLRRKVKGPRQLARPLPTQSDCFSHHSDDVGQDSGPEDLRLLTETRDEKELRAINYLKELSELEEPNHFSYENEIKKLSFEFTTEGNIVKRQRKHPKLKGYEFLPSVVQQKKRMETLGDYNIGETNLIKEAHEEISARIDSKALGVGKIRPRLEKKTTLLPVIGGIGSLASFVNKQELYEKALEQKLRWIEKIKILNKDDSKKEAKEVREITYDMVLTASIRDLAQKMKLKMSKEKAEIEPHGRRPNRIRMVRDANIEGSYTVRKVETQEMNEVILRGRSVSVHKMEVGRESSRIGLNSYYDEQSEEYSTPMKLSRVVSWDMRSTGRIDEPEQEKSIIEAEKRDIRSGSNSVVIAVDDQRPRETEERMQSFVVEEKVEGIKGLKIVREDTKDDSLLLDDEAQAVLLRVGSTDEIGADPEIIMETRIRSKSDRKVVAKNDLREREKKRMQVQMQSQLRSKTGMQTKLKQRLTFEAGSYTEKKTLPKDFEVHVHGRSIEKPKIQDSISDDVKRMRSKLFQREQHNTEDQIDSERNFTDVEHAKENTMRIDGQNKLYPVISSIQSDLVSQLRKSTVFLKAPGRNLSQGSLSSKSYNITTGLSINATSRKQGDPSHSANLILSTQKPQESIQENKMKYIKIGSKKTGYTIILKKDVDDDFNLMHDLKPKGCVMALNSWDVGGPNEHLKENYADYKVNVNKCRKRGHQSKDDERVSKFIYLVD